MIYPAHHPCMLWSSKDNQHGTYPPCPAYALHWRYNAHDGVSNHQPHVCLLNRLFRRRAKKTSKLRVTGLCVGNSPGPVNSPHKWPVTRKMFPFDDVIVVRQWTESSFTLTIIPSPVQPLRFKKWYQVFSLTVAVLSNGLPTMGCRQILANFSSW